MVATEWCAPAPVAALFQSSSAAAERVFSMLSWMFGEDQDAALQDYKEASLLLRYNELWRQREMLNVGIHASHCQFNSVDLIVTQV
jgi:hypothetical protein